MEIVTFATAFLACIVCIATPCCLPLLPGIMAYSTEKNKLIPLATVLGLAMTFTSMGIVSAMLGALFFDHIDYIRFFSGIMIMAMGLYMLFEPLENALLRLWQHAPASRAPVYSLKEEGLLKGLLLGASLGIAWMPCIGPILASILAIVAQRGSLAYGGLLLLTYSLGFAVPMLILAYSSSALSEKLRKMSKYSPAIRRIAGAILVIVGIYYVSTVGLLSLFF